jgi:hypothetical protein
MDYRDHARDLVAELIGEYPDALLGHADEASWSGFPRRRPASRGM